MHHKLWDVVIMALQEGAIILSDCLYSGIMRNSGGCKAGQLQSGKVLQYAEALQYLMCKR